MFRWGIHTTEHHRSSVRTMSSQCCPLLEDPQFPIIGQNLKYEWQVLRQAAGIRLEEWCATLC